MISSPTEPQLPFGQVVLYLLLGTIVLYFSFAEHPDCLFTGTDGKAFQILSNTEKYFRLAHSQLGVNPLEGNFDAYYPWNRDYLLSELLGDLIAGGEPSKAFIFTVNAIFLVICCYILGRTLGVRREVALSAGFLIPIALLPVLQGQPDFVAYPLYGIAPNLSQGNGLGLLLIASFWQLSGGWGRKAIAGLFVPLGCVALTMAAMPQAAVMALPGAAAYGAASLFDAKHWRENLPRVAAVVLAIIGIFVLGFAEYEYGMIKYTAYYFFSHEFTKDRSNLSFASMYFQGRIGITIIVMAYAGALYAAIFEGRRLRIFAIAFILTNSAFLFVAYALIRWANNYEGIAPSYIETYLLPIHLLFCAILVDGVLTQLGRWSPLKKGLSGWIFRWTRWILPMALIAAVAGWNIANAKTQDPDRCQRSPYGVRATPITDRLSSEIAVAPGQEFRGLEATFNGSVGQSATSLYTLSDSNLWWQLNNDHRNIGMWNFRIPTLYNYTTLMTPPYYLLLSEFLARRTDKQVRSVILLTRPDEKMLRLWGVRYLITDHDPGIGTLVMEMTVPTLSELPHETAQLFARDVVQPRPNASAVQKLIQLQDTNLGDYSPTEIRLASDFKSGLAIMREPAIDYHLTVVTDSNIDGPLVAATFARLVLTKPGLNIKASSAGRSVLVLPVQYSRCWSSSSQNVQLFRANLMQMGVLFTGTIDAQLTFRFGPFLASHCRVEDARDMDRLKISEARP